MSCRVERIVFDVQDPESLFSTRTLWPDQPPGGSRSERGLAIVADLKLGHDSAPVGVDARRLYADRRRDFLARPAFHDELQDLAFRAGLSRLSGAAFMFFFVAAEKRKR